MGEIPALSAASQIRKTAAPAAVSAELKAAAKQFEAIFIRQMMTSMRSAKLGDDILGSDSGNQFRDMADSRTADSLADKGSFGIADMLVKQLGARMKTAAPADASAASEGGGGGKAGG